MTWPPHRAAIRERPISLLLLDKWPSDARDGCIFKGDIVEEYFGEDISLLAAHETELEEAGCLDASLFTFNLSFGV